MTTDSGAALMFPLQKEIREATRVIQYSCATSKAVATAAKRSFNLQIDGRQHKQLYVRSQRVELDGAAILHSTRMGHDLRGHLSRSSRGWQRGGKLARSTADRQGQVAALPFHHGLSFLGHS